MDMYDKAKWIVLIVCIFSSIVLIMHAVKVKGSNEAEVINKHMQELSKSCVETHNGTFSTKFMVGDTNQVEYECVIGVK